MHFAYDLLFLKMCISLWPDTHYFSAFFGHLHMIYAVSKHLIKNYSFKLNWCLCSLEKNVDPGTSIPLHLINRRDSVKEAGMLGTPWRFLWERLWRDGMGTQSLGRISTQTANSGILPTGWEVGGGRWEVVRVETCKDVYHISHPTHWLILASASLYFYSFLTWHLPSLILFSSPLLFLHALLFHIGNRTNISAASWHHLSPLP